MRGLRWFAILSVLLLATAARADVLVVSDGGPYTSIQPAVSAAQDGDIVLVKSGVYPGFRITDRSVAVVADVQHTVVVAGAVTIDRLPAGKTVVLDRLNIVGPGTKAALNITSSQGSVRVQDCFGTGNSGVASVNADTCGTVGQPHGQTAALVLASHDVAFVGGQFSGGGGAYLWDFDCHLHQGSVWNGGDAGHGLSVDNATVTLYAVTAYGGSGGTGSYARQGGHGVRGINGAQLVLVNVDAIGGPGGDSLDGIFWDEGGDGGHGVSLEGGSHARRLDCELSGGFAGSGWAGLGQNGAPVDGAGTVDSWAGAWRGLGFVNVLREGQVAPLQVSGETGEAVLLYVSLGGSQLVFPAFEGALVLDPSQLIGPYALGVITGGVLTLNVSAPSLPPGWQGLGLLLQGVTIGPSGSRLTSWGHSTLLDAAF
jgi:hypothetical protein